MDNRLEELLEETPGSAECTDVLCRDGEDFHDHASETDKGVDKNVEKWILVSRGKCTRILTFVGFAPDLNKMKNKTRFI